MTGRRRDPPSPHSGPRPPRGNRNRRRWRPPLGQRRHLFPGCAMTPRICALIERTGRLWDYRALFGKPAPLVLKIETTPTLAELDGLVWCCGARGYEMTQAERDAVTVRRAELQRSRK